MFLSIPIIPLSAAGMRRIEPNAKDTMIEKKKHKGTSIIERQQEVDCYWNVQILLVR